MDVLATIEKIVPQRLAMNYKEYLNLATDFKIAEWVNGEVINYMPPTNKHQDLSRFLSVLLDSFIQFFKLGVIRYAPFEVKLWPDGPSREPDIFFIVNEHLPQLTPERFVGAPDLIIEIISPSSASEDRVRKFTEYERAGVREYWLIDPRPRQQQADFYVLGADKVYYAAPIGDDGRYQSTVITDFWLNIEWLRQNTLPNPQSVLAEIMMSIDTLPSNVKATYQALYQILNPAKP
jgi:Uma2 family endonuclease